MPRGSVNVECACGWRSHRVPRDPLDPNRADVGGFGVCPKCSGRLARATPLLDKRMAKARAELQAFAAAGVRL